MSFNNFLSTSRDHDASLVLAESAIPDPNLIGVFFGMIINPRYFLLMSKIRAISMMEANKTFFLQHTLIFCIDRIEPISKSDTDRLLETHIIVIDSENHG